MPQRAPTIAPASVARLALSPGVYVWAMLSATRWSQVASDSGSRMYGCGLARQHENGRLESIFGIMPIAKDLPADSEHEEAVPLQNGRKSPFIAASDKLLKQLTIAQAIGLLVAGQAAEILNTSVSAWFAMSFLHL